MNCQGAREWFSAWVDDALDASERAQLDAHLSGCADCRRELDRLARTVSLLKAVEPPRAPAGFTDRVIAAARPAPRHRRLLGRLTSVRPLRVPIEAAAVVLVATLAVYVFQRTPELERAARPATPAVTAERQERAEPPAPGPAARDAVRAPREKLAAPPPSSGPTAALPAPGAQPGLARGRLEPPGPAPEREDDARRASPGRRDVPAETSVRAETAPPPAAPGAASRVLRLPPAVPVAGRLRVKDRHAADRELADLLSRIGGEEIARRAEAGAAVVDVAVPGAAYVAFADGLARMGSWTPDAEPSPLPARVLITLRITDE